ncbi:MAG: hypothetical protein FWF43_06340 [Propionibacteriaceae bacterium]|nr:hypothetical protein [Propionibacteriaceae bacterium]
MNVSRVSVIALVGVFFLAGCTSTAPVGAPSSASEPALGAIATITSPDQITLPIDAYLPDVDQSVSLMLVGQDLVNSCITSQGSDATIHLGIASTDGGTLGAFQPATVDNLTTFMSRVRAEDKTYAPLWGFFNPDTVAQYGYARSPGNTTLVGSGGVSQAYPSGDPVATSCRDKANSVAPGGQSMGPIVVEELPDQGPPVPTNDSRYVAVAQTWSACMAKNGFNYATPQDAIAANYQPRTDAEKATAKAVAVLDVQCKLDTNLVGVAVAIESAYEQQYIDSHQDELAKFQTQIADYLAGRVTIQSVSPSPGGGSS